MTEVHPAAARGFSRAAEAYELGRPGYPRDALDWLAGRLGLAPGRTVLDLAAGTGKLTRELLRTRASVVAVEPVAEMRSLLPAEARILAGTAEAIPLEEGSVDAVTVAQAFHWFDADSALVEIHRVLRAGGRLALVWNRRGSDQLDTAIEELLAPLRGDVPTHRDSAWQAALERTELFGPPDERSFGNSQELDAEGLAARIGSISFVAALDVGPREELLRRVRALARGGSVELGYSTDVEVFGRRD
jgi:SAM-dependent methyltransferase